MLNRFQIATNPGSHMFDISVKASMMSSGVASSKNWGEQKQIFSATAFRLLENPFFSIFELISNFRTSDILKQHFRNGGFLPVRNRSD